MQKYVKNKGLSNNEIHLFIFSLDKLFLPTFSSCVYFESLDFEAIVISSSSHLGQRCFNRQFSFPVRTEKWKLAKENFPFLSVPVRGKFSISGNPPLGGTMQILFGELPTAGTYLVKYN